MSAAASGGRFRRGAGRVLKYVLVAAGGGVGVLGVASAGLYVWNRVAVSRYRADSGGRELCRLVPTPDGGVLAARVAVDGGGSIGGGGAAPSPLTVLVECGLGGAQAEWWVLADALTAHYSGSVRVITYDRRGHGFSSDVPPPPPGADAGAALAQLLVRDAAALVDALAPPGDGLVLVGHHFGAPLAVALAAALPPGRVRGAAFVDPLCDARAWAAEAGADGAPLGVKPGEKCFLENVLTAMEYAAVSGWTRVRGMLSVPVLDPVAAWVLEEACDARNWAAAGAELAAAPAAFDSLGGARAGFPRDARTVVLYHGILDERGVLHPGALDAVSRYEHVRWQALMPAWASLGACTEVVVGSRAAAHMPGLTAVDDPAFVTRELVALIDRVRATSPAAPGKRKGK